MKKRKRTKKKKEKSRITSWGLFIILFIVAAGLCTPFIVWNRMNMKPLRVTVYDKTITGGSTAHHETLAWYLRQYKYPDRYGNLFDTKNSYLGYHPEADNPFIDLTDIDERTDVLYVADTYGVFKDPADVAEGESALLWGGSTLSDAAHLRSFLNREKSSTLIAESNTMADSTPYYVQAEMYQILGTRWTGWDGLYIYDLGNIDEIPSRYLDNHEGPWNYDGNGIILTNLVNEVVVLEGADISFSFTEEGKERLDLSGTLPYLLTFDITESKASTSTLAEFTINAGDEELQLLEHYGIPSVFPAVQMKETANNRAYYFSGNWAYNARRLNFSRASFLVPLLEHFAPKEEKFLWQVYMPLLHSIFSEAIERSSEVIPPLNKDLYTSEGTSLTARATARELQIYQEGEWEPFFVEGVNLGTAMPGKWFTDFPNDRSLYYRWFTQMGELGVNTLRIYTLLDPFFYSAFSLYNRIHPDNPIYLMQEVWPEENPPGHDYLKDEYVSAFEKEIEYVIDAVHGNADIAERRGRAWGTYTIDISDYVIGYLVGRELEPIEVEETDAEHRGYRYEGNYIGTTMDATPTEAWLASACDYLISYEQGRYGEQHPVSLVNWPILDYIDHESERDENGIKENEFNDRTVVNINHLTLGPLNLAGLFGSYHIYPNYPDFMNNDPLYDQWSDEKGRLRYGGYLKEFMAGHQKYPAVVAEFGLSTGMGNAHTSPDGYNHGGMSEEVQGEGIIRMFEAMRAEGYSGGIIFEWMDEWAKKTWTTEPYMIPYERQILWHNAIDPEQNYGITAYEAVKPARAGTEASGEGIIEKMQLRADASFLSVDLTLSEIPDFTAEQVLIGIDTLDRDRGELLYLPSSDIEAPSGMEYLVRLASPEDSRLFAIEEADYTRFAFSTSDGLKRTGEFLPMSRLINKARALEDGTPIPAHYEDASTLRYGDQEGNTNHWKVEGKSITLRIPWTRINVSDPSSGRVLNDAKTYYTDPLRDIIETAVTDGIVVSAVISSEGELSEPLSATLPLEEWNQPVYSERLKKSYDILRTYFTQERTR